MTTLSYKERAKLFIDDYAILCQKHNMAVTADNEGLTYVEIYDDSDDLARNLVYLEEESLNYRP